MGAIKLLFVFSPWIAFWIIAGGHSLWRLQIGICVAAAMIVVMGITRLHRGSILWAGVAFFNVILLEPQIPPNTGNVIRMCANTGSTLHLVHPLGFTLAACEDHVGAIDRCAG